MGPSRAGAAVGGHAGPVQHADRASAFERELERTCWLAPTNAARSFNPQYGNVQRWGRGLHDRLQHEGRETLLSWRCRRRAECALQRSVLCKEACSAKKCALQRRVLCRGECSAKKRALFEHGMDFFFKQKYYAKCAPMSWQSVGVDLSFKQKYYAKSPGKVEHGRGMDLVFKQKYYATCTPMN